LACGCTKTCQTKCSKKVLARYCDIKTWWNKLDRYVWVWWFSGDCSCSRNCAKVAKPSDEKKRMAKPSDEKKEWLNHQMKKKEWQKKKKKRVKHERTG